MDSIYEIESYIQVKELWSNEIENLKNGFFFFFSELLFAKSFETVMKKISISNSSIKSILYSSLMICFFFTCWWTNDQTIFANSHIESSIEPVLFRS